MHPISLARILAIIGFYFAGFLVFLSAILVNYGAFAASGVIMLVNAYFWQLMEGNL